MKQHHGPEGPQVINRIRSSIVAFQLRELEGRWNRFLHDFLRERRVCTNVITTRGGTKFFNSPVHFREPLAQQVLPVSDLQGFLVRWARGFTLGRSMIRTRALPPPPLQSGYRRSGCPGRSLLDWIIRLRGVPRRSGWHWDLLVQHRLHRLRETANVLDELVELLRIHCGY